MAKVDSQQVTDLNPGSQAPEPMPSTFMLEAPREPIPCWITMKIQWKRLALLLAHPRDH